MPAFHELTSDEIDLLITYLTTSDRIDSFFGPGTPVTFPPGPIVETGPTAKRPDMTGKTGGMTDIPQALLMFRRSASQWTHTVSCLKPSNLLTPN